MTTLTIKADTGEAEAAIERVTEKVRDLTSAMEGLLALGVGIRLNVNWDGAEDEAEEDTPQLVVRNISFTD